MSRVLTHSSKFTYVLYMVLWYTVVKVKGRYVLEMNIVFIALPCIPKGTALERKTRKIILISLVDTFVSFSSGSFLPSHLTCYIYMRFLFLSTKILLYYSPSWSRCERSCVPYIT